MDDVDALPAALPPLAVDIDGTLTDENRVLDPRVLPILAAWPDAVVVATGKSMPYPVALCDFLGRDPFVVAENGGVALAGRDGTFRRVGDHEAIAAFADAFRDRGLTFGWGAANLVNRWRETELAIARSAPYDAVAELAAAFDLVVLDTGFAYHVTSPDVTKATGLATVAEDLDVDVDAFVAIGDSENDAPLLEAVGRSFAVANADEAARRAADHVTEAGYGDGFLEAVDCIRRAERDD